MSGLTNLGALSALKIKKNFPDASAIPVLKTAAITSTWASGLPYEHTDTGIKELTVTVVGTATATDGVLVVFDAPSDAVAQAWFADTTTNAQQLQYRFVPQGATRTFKFDPAITRWDYQATGGNVTIYQEIAR